MTNPKPLSPANTQIIMRHAKNDYDALVTAQGMEDAGASVFSITINDTTQQLFKFLIFAKYDENCLSPHEIDACIERSLYPE